VFLTLHPYRYTLDGIESENDLMATKAGVYGEENSAWSSAEAKGFIHMLSVPLQNYYQLHKEKMPI
jgi:argininosuccinate synthase